YGSGSGRHRLRTAVGASASRAAPRISGNARGPSQAIRASPTPACGAHSAGGRQPHTVGSLASSAARPASVSQTGRAGGPGAPVPAPCRAPAARSNSLVAPFTAPFSRPTATRTACAECTSPEADAQGPVGASPSFSGPDASGGSAGNDSPALP